MNLKPAHLFFLLCVTVLFYLSCTKPNTGYNSQGGLLPTHYIKILTDSFSPMNLTVSIGSSITFVNSSNDNHTIISDDGFAIVTPTIAPATSFYYKKDTIGIINYHCIEHPTIRGTIQFRP